MATKQGWTFNEHSLSIYRVATDGYSHWRVTPGGFPERGVPPMFETKEEALAAMKVAAKELAEKEYRRRLAQIEAATGK